MLAPAGVLVLGIWHGVNPGMGWLFAVALGLQEQERRAVWRALLPLAAGHALAIAAALAVAALIGMAIPPTVLKWTVAISLIAFGITKLVRNRHPRFGGMRVGARDLTIWSFLMASAHGAGLMVLPLVVGHAANAAHHGGPGQLGGIAATLMHTIGYLAATGLIAFVVYEKLGLRMLRTIWVNLDIVWAIALIATGALTPLL